MSKCEYPGCSIKSTKTWGFVPLCASHHQDILKESLDYYGAPKKQRYETRLHYLKIAPKIPWSREN